MTKRISHYFLFAFLSLAFSLQGAFGFNNDAKSDIAWFNQTSGASSIWTMNGGTKSGDIGLPANGDPRWKMAGTGDFNKDGQLDLVWWHPTTGQIVYWYLNGNQVISNGVVSTTQSDKNWEIVGTGYFGGIGDRTVDFLWFNNVTRQVGIWNMNGTTFVSGTVLATLASNWKVGGVGDFNGDHQSDIIFKNYSTGGLSIWNMNGNTWVSSSIPSTTSPDPNWLLAGTGHFNSDTNIDLVWRNQATGENALWFMNGPNYESSALIPMVTDQTWKIGATGDSKLDTDGDDLADLWEQNSFGSIATQTGNDDYDGDLIGNAAEFNSIYNSNPLLKFSKSASVADGEYRLTAQTSGATMAKLSGISFQGDNVVLTLTGAEVGVEYDIYFSTDLSSWQLLSSDPADNSSTASTRTYTIPNPNVPVAYFEAGDARDFDSDGLSNGYELLVSRTIVDSPASGGSAPATILTSGGYYIEEITIPLTPLPEDEGVFVNADGNTGDSFVVRETSPGQTTFTLQSVFIKASQGTLSAMGTIPVPSEAEKAIVQAAYDQGAKLQIGRVARVNVQLLSTAKAETLQYYEQIAANTLRKSIHNIQALRSGTKSTVMPLEKAIQIEVNQIATQAARLKPLNTILRRLGKILPFAGGIMIIASGDAYAEEMVGAMDEYGRDIINGNDETGSAAIVAGYCNDLAPGAGNIVLDNLLVN